MIAIAIDTAFDACSVALGDEGGVRAARFEERAAGQAERLIPMIEEVLSEAGLTAPAIGRIGVTVGPGSFTGTRIGLAAARALGLALGVPVIGMTTLDALALQTPEDHAALVAFDARRSQIYVQMFAPGRLEPGRRALTAPLALSLAEAAERLPPAPAALTLIGSAARALAEALPEDRFTIATIEPALYPDAAAFLPAVIRRRAAAGGMPRPLYLRPSGSDPRDLRVP